MSNVLVLALAQFFSALGQVATVLLAGLIGTTLAPDPSLATVPVATAVIGDDTRLEGRGVQPDLPVPFILPYAAGRDPQRDAAVDEMRRILADG